MPRIFCVLFNLSQFIYLVYEMYKPSVISHCHVSRGAIWVKSCWFSLLLFVVSTAALLITGQELFPTKLPGQLPFLAVVNKALFTTKVHDSF